MVVDGGEVYNVLYVSKVTMQVDSSVISCETFTKF